LKTTSRLSNRHSVELGELTIAVEYGQDKRAENALLPGQIVTVTLLNFRMAQGLLTGRVIKVNVNDNKN
jgi:hypothetical protein